MLDPNSSDGIICHSNSCITVRWQKYARILNALILIAPYAIFLFVLIPGYIFYAYRIPSALVFSIIAALGFVCALVLQLFLWPHYYSFRNKCVICGKTIANDVLGASLK